MDNQTAFETAVKGILAQGALGYVAGRCVYFDPNTGNRCAVGQLLSLENADKWQKTWRDRS